MEQTEQSSASAAADLSELAERARQGDASVLPALRQALEADPSLWETYGDLAVQAQAAWLDLLAGKNLLLSEAVQQKLGALRAELGGPSPSPLERLLVERVVACWLQLHYADISYS